MDKPYSEVNIEDVNVWCESTKGVMGVEEVVKKLEFKIQSLRGRKCYGVLFGSPTDGLYRACVSMKKEDKFDDIEKWIIPGGKYMKTKIGEWEKNPGLIGATFGRMFDECKVDETRPCIEYYRSQRELILLVPVK